MAFSMGSSQLRDRTYISLHLLHVQAGSLPLLPLGNPCLSTIGLSDGIETSKLVLL